MTSFKISLQFAIFRIKQTIYLEVIKKEWKHLYIQILSIDLYYISFRYIIFALNSIN
jgi:hypothetical protein